jgi:hypothetical protein
MYDLNFSFLVVGSQEMIWESLADDGYVVEHLNKSGMDKDDQSHRVDTCVVDGSEKIEQVAIRVRDILNYAKGKKQILMVYIVDSVAITFALLLLAKCETYGEHIADIQILNAEGGFDSIFEARGRV